jgi:alcohol dehydrogenase (cytochrome c)
LTSADDQEQLEDHQGGSTQALGTTEMNLIAIDYQTGQVKWKLAYGNAAGVLTTAGRLLFTSNSGYFVALDPATGKTLWKYNPGGPETNAPMTYELDGRQYVVLAAQSKLCAFALPNSFGN